MSDNLPKNSFINKYKSAKENSFDIAKINANDGSNITFIKIFSIICDNTVDLSYINHVAYLNILVYLSASLLKTYQNQSIFIISIFSIIKFSLWNDCKLVRTAALRCLRYYLLNRYHTELFLKMRIDFLIMRSLDLSYEDAINNQYRGNDDAERIHCMRFLYRLSLIAPKLFPSSLINTLTMICISSSENNGTILDIALRPALLILCQLLILDPNLPSKNEILRALQTVIFNQDGKSWCLNFRIIEAVLLTQLKLITYSSWRRVMPPGYFNKTLTPFSILSKVQPESLIESGYFRNFSNEQLEFEATSISILLTILQSWSGLLYLYGSNNKPILSLTGLLQVGCSSIRGRILNLLFQLFDIFRPPSECKDFVSCIKAIADQNSCKYRPYWNLDDEFLVGQCNDCLPHISPKRINIIDNYQAVLLGMFVQSNLFEALECAVADNNESISARAGILLANIAYKVSILLPADHPLIGRSDASMLFSNPKSQKALLWIHQVQKLLEKPQFEITPFLTYIIQQQPNNNVNEYGIQIKRYLQPTNIDEILDSCSLPSATFSHKKNQSISQQATNKNYRVGGLLDQIVRHSRIFESSDDKPFYDTWDWELLMVFSRSLVDSKSTMNIDKESFSRVLKVLIKFFMIQTDQISKNGDYRNSNEVAQQFASLPLTWAHSSNAAFVVTDIIGFLVDSSKDSEIAEELDSFLLTIYSCLKDCLMSIVDDKYIDKVKNQFNLSADSSNDSSPVFSEYDLNYKCSSFLILAVGRMSVSDTGETLLEKYGLVELFKAFLDYSRNDVVTKLILGSLDYTRPSLGRSLLSIAIRSDNIFTRRYSTKFLKVLLRARVPFYANWGVNLLMKQLHDCDFIVRQAAFEILLEASDDEVVVNNLSVESIATLHMDFSGYMLFSRLLSLPTHFEKLNCKNGINFFLDTWKEKFALKYCEIVDAQLMQYFTNYEIPNSDSHDPDDHRWSSKMKSKPKELILPCHPYGSISERKEGMDILLRRGDLQECLNIIVQEWNRLCENDFQEENHADFFSLDAKELLLRSNMFAICHVATSPWGLEFMTNTDMPLIISQMTQFHPSLNVRGTGLLCLGLLGSTRRGADVLLDYDWLSLRSDRHDKWPLLLDAFHNVQKNRSRIKKQLQSPTEIECSLKPKSNFMDGNEKPVRNSVYGINSGYSVFAVKPEDEGKNQTPDDALLDRSSLMNNMSDKSFYKSIDDSVFKSRTGTGVSSNSSNFMSEGEQQTKLTRLIHHHREFSAGASSMFTIQPDETTEAISPHDVLGIATMRRLQRKSRSGLFQKNSLSLNNCNLNCNSQSCDENSESKSLGIFSNIRKASICLKDVSNHRKKFSSLLNPMSHLNKYRGLVLPINFYDLTINIFEEFCDELRMDSSDSEKAEINAGNSTVVKRDLGAIEHDSVFDMKSSSRYISLEESSCVLDIALLANESSHTPRKSENIKEMRSSSAEQTIFHDQPVSLRPRATTTHNCGVSQMGDSKSDLNNHHHANSMSTHVASFRNIYPFAGNYVSQRNESNNGLIYHSEDHCIHVCCEGSQVIQEVIEFRQKILKSVGFMLNINSKTKKMEMNLAKLKACKGKLSWADPCLYSEICILMSLYSFSRPSRQYLQELFLTIPMTQFRDDMKLCLEEFSKETNIRCSYSTKL